MRISDWSSDVCSSDLPRRFGSLDLVRSEAREAYNPFTRMGPEPLGPDFTPDSLTAALKGKATSIKAALLDQRIVAGLGNIYVCEALNMAGIAPTREAGRVGRARLVLLVDAIREVLAAAIAAGGSTLRDYARPDGGLGYLSKQWRVFGREGGPCVRGTPHRRRVGGGG